MKYCTNEPCVAVGKNCCSPPLNRETRTYLLVSGDVELGNKLRIVANRSGRIVVRVDKAVAILIARATRPAAILVDLGEAMEAMLKVANSLLELDFCSPLFLLTTPGEKNSVSMKIDAGAIIDRTASAASVLEVVDTRQTTPASDPAKRNAVQRVTMRWSEPDGWVVPLSPQPRFWGINE